MSMHDHSCRILIMRLIDICKDVIIFNPRRLSCGGHAGPQTLSSDSSTNCHSRASTNCHSHSSTNCHSRQRVCRAGTPPPGGGRPLAARTACGRLRRGSPPAPSFLVALQQSFSTAIFTRLTTFHEPNYAHFCRKKMSGKIINCRVRTVWEQTGPGPRRRWRSSSSSSRSSRARQVSSSFTPTAVVLRCMRGGQPPCNSLRRRSVVEGH